MFLKKLLLLLSPLLLQNLLASAIQEKHFQIDLPVPVPIDTTKVVYNPDKNNNIELLFSIFF